MAKLPVAWDTSLVVVEGQLLVALGGLLSSCDVQSPLEVCWGAPLLLRCTGGTPRVAVECSS